MTIPFALESRVFLRALQELSVELAFVQDLEDGRKFVVARYGYEEFDFLVAAEGEFCSPGQVLEVCVGLRVPLDDVRRVVTDAPWRRR
ncbi:MAG: hypothetical protein KDB80_03655 [Planctomycetes bacterium]|nr:hypothetical protein [Planctomycetota bacterium]